MPGWPNCATCWRGRADVKRNNPFADATTSLIDIAFILILFFVISMVLRPEDVVPLKLPNNFSEGEPEIRVDDDIVFHVLRDGSVIVEDEVLTDSTAADSILFSMADALLLQYREARENGKVILKADSGAVWDRPIQIMQAAGKHGLPLSIALEPSQLSGSLIGAESAATE